MDNAELLTHLDKIHTTPLGKERVRKNLCLNADDVVAWCVQVIVDKDSNISRKGKKRQKENFDQLHNETKCKMPKLS
jgi:hypothetical protein